MAKGRVHDFGLFKQGRLSIHPDLELLADSGYQGIQKLHKKSWIPHKKSKKKKLTGQEKKDNRALASLRIGVENVNRWCKIFKIAKDVYRGKHRELWKGLERDSRTGKYEVQRMKFQIGKMSIILKKSQTKS